MAHQFVAFSEEELDTDLTLDTAYRTKNGITLTLTLQGAMPSGFRKAQHDATVELRLAKNSVLKVALPGAANLFAVDYTTPTKATDQFAITSGETTQHFDGSIKPASAVLWADGIETPEISNPVDDLHLSRLSWSATD